MVDVPAFDAATWIRKKTENGTSLTPEAISAVANFTMMWNIFEGTLCNNRACLRKFNDIAECIDNMIIPDKYLRALEQCLAFWKVRYLTPDGFLAQRFDGLNFRANDKREFVADVLSEKRDDLVSKVIAMMIIVYRLRNNLFHGLKSTDRLNHQVDNLNVASHCIAILMSISGSKFVEHRLPRKMR